MFAKILVRLFFALLGCAPLAAAGQVVFTDIAEVNTDARPVGVVDHRLRPAQGRLMFRQYKNAAGTNYLKFDYLDSTGYKFAGIRHAPLVKLVVGPGQPYHHRVQLLGVLFSATSDQAYLFIKWPVGIVAGEFRFVIQTPAGQVKFERRGAIASDALLTRPVDAPQF